MSNFSAQAPVGIFDSGIGGLSVLRHIRHRLPGEALCYFADAGFAPYGDRSEQEIEQRTLVAAHHLLQQGVKAVVVACNTATAAAISVLRAHYPELIIIGVEPGLKPAASVSTSGWVGVLATSATLASTKYQHLCQQIQQTSPIHFVHQACPGLADRIEQGDLDGPATLALLKVYLAPILASPADTLVLGCTHYPFVEQSILSLISQHGKQSMQIIDTGLAIARQLERLLQLQGLLNPETAHPPLLCSTSGSAALIDFAMHKLLKLKTDDFIIQKIDCK